MNRRDFIKKSVFASTLTAGVVAANPTVALAKESKGIFTKEHNKIDDVLKISDSYERFDMKNTAFNISLWSTPNPLTHTFAQKGEVENWKFMNYPTENDTQDPYTLKNFPGSLQNMMMKKKLMTPEIKSKPGYTDIDVAFSLGGRAIQQKTGGIWSEYMSSDSGFFIPVPKPDGSVMALNISPFKSTMPGSYVVNPVPYQFESKKAASYAIKKAAKVYGADLVGIAPYDERWVYKTEVYAPINMVTGQIDPDKFQLERPVEFGFEPKSVIVLCHEQDYEALKTSPAHTANGTVATEYSKMTEVSSKLAWFLNEIGYETRHAGNDLALSVPLAISAGLGESSRMGLLITEEYGPRVRISKVFTNLELEYDKPKTFGVKEFCKVCMKCADNCPAESISRVADTTDPENKPINRCNNPGTDKWYNDNQKCMTFWGKNFIGCANCISTCPYNKIDVWHHHVAEAATKVPGLRGLARDLDEMFGYGIVDNEEAMTDFWKKPI